ncbi:MAG: hypothetical protein U1D55_00560 [Phycisphaerae bacterium]
MTEESYLAREPCSGNMAIETGRVLVMLTSNQADFTADLANRSSIVRILKQPEGYRFLAYAEGDILDHVRAHQARYLGAVFAAVQAWYAAGRRNLI